MKITTCTIFLCILFYLPAFCQNDYSVRGIAIDSALSKKMHGISVSILNAKDSMLVIHDRTNSNGEFNLTKILPGQYLLLLTFPNYVDYVEVFSLEENHKEKNFSIINMRLKSMLLSEVIVRGSIQNIEIKGDTTEYNAKKYVIQPNASVEDLLKQLPGISIDRYGKITAQGKTVNTVLVEGEEFFTDDPTLVTKNLRADMIDKVQLYDKKSDRATFTGIDDGIKNKTINLKLKEDKKTGYFGKIDAQLGTNQRYQEQAIFNKFSTNYKISAYGTFANTGKIGLGVADNNKYGSSGLEFAENGTIMVTSFSGSNNLDNYSGRYDGRGLPETKSGGIHYDSKINGKGTLNLNYKIGSFEVNGINSTLIQSNLPNGINFITRSQSYNNNLFRQKFDGTFLVPLDTTSNLKVFIDGTQKRIDNLTKDFSTNTSNNILLNSNDRNFSNVGNQEVINTSILYTKKFKKPGRTLTLLTTGGYIKNQTNGYLKSQINFYNASGGISNSDNVDQFKVDKNSGSIISSTFSYSELLYKPLSVVFSYGLTISSNNLERTTFDKSPSGDYNILNSTYSNQFKLNQFSNIAGAIFNYRKNKSVLTLGTKASLLDFKETDRYTNTVYQRKFLNWFPQFGYQYRPSQQETISINYNGSNIQPTADQLQPVTINIDPLNVITGNINLDPSFSNRFTADYNSNKVLSGQTFNVTAMYAYVVNPIINNTFIDALGRTNNQYINILNKKTNNYNIHASTSKRIKFIDANLEVFADFFGNTSYGVINNTLNRSNSLTYSGGVNISKYKQRKYDLYFSFGPSYYIGRSSLQPDINSNGAGFSISESSTIYLPWKFQFVTDVNYTYTAKTQSFNQDLKRTLLYFSLSRTFLKEDKLKVTFLVNDLLNQNIGFLRNTNGNVITQNSYNTLRRYFMLTILYDFTKFGTIK